MEFLNTGLYISHIIVSHDGVGGHISWLRCGRQEIYKTFGRERSWKKGSLGILINKYVYDIKIDLKGKS